MVTVPFTAFNGGEVAPEFLGRIDQTKYFTSAKTLDGYIAREIGVASARGGTVHVAEVKDSSKKVLLIEFVFSNVDPYILEIGDLYMRFYRARGQITETAKTITGATQANPVVITSTAHGFANGDQVALDSVGGMTELNGKRYDVANVTANTFELSGVDGTGFTAYTSGGNANRIYTITSPYAEADLFDADGVPQIQFAQSADFLFLAHADYAPRQLTRTGDTSWTLSTYEPTVGPFQDENITTTTLTFSGLGAAKTITAATQGNPIVVTSTAHGLANGDIVLLKSVVGMTELNDRRFRLANVATNTFELEGEDGSAHTAYASGGTAQVVNEDVGDTGTLTASAALFVAGDVDTQILVRLGDYDDIPPWQTGDRYVPGALYNSDSLVYEVVAHGDSGAEPPSHLEGERWDGATTQQSLGDNRVITGITQANPAVVTSANHGFNDADVVFISGVVGMTEVNDRFFTVANALTNTFELRSEDSTGHTVYSSAGAARRRQLPAVRWKFRHGGAVAFKVTGFTSSTVVDVEIVTDAAGFEGKALKTWRQDAWSAAQGYPRAVEMHENRLLWAGTSEQPLAIFLSASLDFFDFSPFFIDGSVQDSTAFTRELNSRNPIRWMKSSDKGLVVGTIGGEWLLTTSSLSDALTPATALARQFAENGASAIPPARVGEALLYADFSKKRVRDIIFDLDVSQLRPDDLNHTAAHVFSSTIAWMSWASEPFNLLWCGRKDGRFACLTYNQDEDIKVEGWHQHGLAGTDAKAESGASIPSPDNQVSDLWMVVSRTINGGTKRYIEYLTQPECSSTDAGCYVDSALVYNGAPATVISGLDHLEGETVRIVTDGANHEPLVVTNGQITLDQAGSVVHVGLYETKVMEILPIEFESGIAITAQGRKKRAKKATVRLISSRGGYIGTDADNMDRMLFDETTMDAAPALFTGDLEQVLPGGYAEQAIVRIEQRDPQPMNVAAMFVVL